MSDPPVRLARLVDDFQGNHVFLREIYTEYMEDSDEHVAEIAKAINDHDVGQCSRHAHALKGSSSNVGADQLHILAGKMEVMGKKENDSDLAEFAECSKALQSELKRVKDFLHEYLASLES